jgi:hypothetical protein
VSRAGWLRRRRSRAEHRKRRRRLSVSVPACPGRTGDRPAFSPPEGALVMQPSIEISPSPRPIIRSYASKARAWTCSEIPCSAHSLTDVGLSGQSIRAWRRARSRSHGPARARCARRPSGRRSGADDSPAGGPRRTLPGRAGVRRTGPRGVRAGKMARRAQPSFVITERRELHDHLDPCPRCIHPAPSRGSG